MHSSYYVLCKHLLTLDLKFPFLPQVSVSKARAIIVLASDENADQVSILFCPPLLLFG
jgi:hypothetical protein